MIKEKIIPLKLIPAKRCPDYDEECKEVKSPYSCFIGVASCGTSIGMADGYCPFLVGEVK